MLGNPSFTGALKLATAKIVLGSLFCFASKDLWNADLVSSQRLEATPVKHHGLTKNHDDGRR